MSKERLEEIKERFGATQRLYNEPLKVTITEEFKGDISYLVEQAERVQELEDELLYYKMATESYVDMEQQNKRYREAIAKTIEDLENGCLWDALVSLKALEGDHETD